MFQATKDGLTYLGTVAWDQKTGSTSYTPDRGGGLEGEGNPPRLKTMMPFVVPNLGLREGVGDKL